MMDQTMWGKKRNYLWYYIILKTKTMVSKAGEDVLLIVKETAYEINRNTIGQL